MSLVVEITVRSGSAPELLGTLGIRNLGLDPYDDPYVPYDPGGLRLYEWQWRPVVGVPVSGRVAHARRDGALALVREAVDAAIEEGGTSSA